MSLDTAIQKQLAGIAETTYRAVYQGVEMKLELKRISLWATIKISFLVNLVLGFVVGCFYALLLVMISSIPSAAFRDSEFDQLSGMFGVLAIFVPFFFAFFAAIFNTIFAFILVVVYNFAARTMGGLELDFNSIIESTATLAPIAAVPAPIPTTPIALPPVPSPAHSPDDQTPTEPPQDYRL